MSGLFSGSMYISGVAIWGDIFWYIPVYTRYEKRENAKIIEDYNDSAFHRGINLCLGRLGRCCENVLAPAAKKGIRSRFIIHPQEIDLVLDQLDDLVANLLKAWKKERLGHLATVEDF